MSNVNDHKNFTTCGDTEAEMLLEKVLSEMQERFSDTTLCVFLGGSYGRGEGGVRNDRENGILYNDLDFFVFSRKKQDNAESVLREITEKYEKELRVDVDFSRIMNVRDIENNASRLMMQELKRGYRLVAGEDLLEKYLPMLPAEKLPLSEACRLLLNRGMGLLYAGEKIALNDNDTDFILRNINKGILGACDAMLITEQNYRWKITERQAVIKKSDLPVEYKNLYAAAVAFKQNPSRNITEDITLLHKQSCNMFLACMERIIGKNTNEIYRKCRKNGEISWKNYLKYCIKSRRIPLLNFYKYTVPTVALLLPDLYDFLKNGNHIVDRNGKLYQHWLKFN